MKTTNTLSQHTPGPWSTLNPDEMDRDSKRPHWETIVQADYRDNVVARVYQGAWNNAAESNARLIAAAPDLLAALESMVELAEQGDALPDEMPILEKAQIAIARAYGRDRNN